VLTRVVLILALLLQPGMLRASWNCASRLPTQAACSCCGAGEGCGSETACNCADQKPTQDPQTPPQSRPDQAPAPALLVIAILAPAPPAHLPALVAPARSHAGPAVQALLCIWRT
jgi:hypothetical protein